MNAEILTTCRNLIGRHITVTYADGRGLSGILTKIDAEQDPAKAVLVINTPGGVAGAPCSIITSVVEGDRAATRTTDDRPITVTVRQAREQVIKAAFSLATLGLNGRHPSPEQQDEIDYRNSRLDDALTAYLAARAARLAEAEDSAADVEGLRLVRAERSTARLDSEDGGERTC